MASVIDSIKEFLTRHPNLHGFLKDLAFSITIVAIIAILLYSYAGVWPPMVSVNGKSMFPNMENGDLVIIQGIDRAGVQTYVDSLDTGYRMYNGFGDVIVYKPYGDTSRPLVIHRVVRWVNESEPMWPDGPLAPHAGYITLGDNNHGVYDQAASICYGEPVRKEWVIGVARYKVPYLGYLRSLI